MNKVHSKMIRNIIYAALAFMVIFGIVLGKAEWTSASEEDSNYTNLIIFMRFADEDEFIDDVYQGTKVRKITDNSYNTAMYNVADYYRCVSDNKLRMKSVYLLDNGGSIKLSHQRGYYAEYSEDNPIGYRDTGEASSRMYDLRQEWSDAVNKTIAAGNQISNYDGTIQYSYDELDKNGDGTIDSITIIYKNTTQSNIHVSWASPLWNYQYYADYITIKTDKGSIKSGNYVQLTNSYTKPGSDDSNGYLYKDSNGNVIMSISVATHEMGHIMGLKDLYNSSQSSPIYYMSAMAKHFSPVAQFISLKEKEVLGWINAGDIKTISSAGEYSMRALGTSGDGVVGYKFDIPEKGKTAYLEYRNFGSNGNKYDSQDKRLYKINGNQVDRMAMKSGLVCYLVDSDTKFPNNMNCTSPKWNYEVLGGQYSTKTDAALAENDELWVTGDIGIYVTSIDENTLTFEIEGNFSNHTHSGGKATCIKKAICSICGSEYGQLDDTVHEHTAVRGAKASSCTEKGYTGDTYCTDCNKTLNKGSDIEKTSHNLQHVAAKEATVTKEGNIEYYYCTKCNNCYTDEAAKHQISKDKTIIPKKTPEVTEPSGSEEETSTKEETGGNDGETSSKYEESSSAIGYGKIEGVVDKNIFSVIMPKSMDSKLEFIIDPQKLIKETKAAHYSGKVFDDGTLFFKHTEKVDGKDYTNTSDSFTIVNRSTFDVDITLKVTFESDGIKLTSDKTFAGDKDASIYLAIKTGDSEKVITEDGITITIKLSKAPDNAFEYRYDKNSDKYSYNLKQESDLADIQFDKCEFSFTGAANTAGNWSNFVNVKPVIKTEWSIRRHVD